MHEDDKHIVESKGAAGWWNAGEFIGSGAYSEALAYARRQARVTKKPHRVIQHLVRDVIDPSEETES